MKKRIVILLLLALSMIFALSSCEDVLGDILGGEEIPATVSFDTRGGNEIPDVTVNVGDLITEPDAPVREGYEFAGWYTDDSLSFKWRFDVDEVEGDMTLYAGWKKLPLPPHKCESKCPECGKCLDEACTEAACKDKCTEHGTVIPPHGCVNVCPECGKCTNEYCTEDVCAEKCQGHTATVSFDTRGGNEIPDVTVNVGDLITEPDAPIREGYEFAGWYTDDSLSFEWRFDVDEVEGDMTLYAGWKKLPPPPHKCESVCPECGKCLDEACADTACAEKCQGHTVTPPAHDKKYNISYEGLDGWLLEGYSPDSATEGDTVILRANPIMDADLELYVNGVKINQTYADYDYWEYVFTMPSEDVTVTKKVVEGFLPDPGVGDIEITLAEAGAETIYFEWTPLDGVDGYKVYCDTIPVDNELIRFYGDHYRCDILGIRAELHFVKVVPVVGGVEVEDKSTEFSATPTSHLREGFAFVGNGDGNGAYNSDGTLKAGAVVIYVTNTNKNTISLSMKTDSKKTETKTGIQNILLGLKKGYYEYPLCVRFIGNITDPAVLQGGDLAVDINNRAFTKGITIEGVGNDAVFNGFGLKLKGAKNVEVRNLAFMNCNSSEGDNVSLTQDNEHIWIHNCDFFYGAAGSDADQAKGDGALDTKVSQYVTYSYNRFWDCGKVHLNGNGDTTVNYISYHHNWYDHCDSRMPRVRVSESIHVYNNFYDGISKYGVGATMGSSIFVENNYFLNTSRPMSISMQGLDNGTFSSEDGGMIKAYGNVMIGCTDLITYTENNTSFDYYDASSRDERVPSSVVALKGGSAYSNFDTDSDMYSYNVQTPEAAMESVKRLSGRVQGGDFKWTFTDKDNTDYNVNSALKSALVNYKTSLISVGGLESKDVEIPEGDNNGVDIPVITDGIVHNFTTDGLNSEFFQITGNLSTSKGKVVYDGLTLTRCLKMESSTSITFTMSTSGTIILVIGGTDSANEWRVDIDGVDHQNITPEGAENYMLCIVELEAGTHTIEKKDKTNLYYIVIEQSSETDSSAE